VQTADFDVASFENSAQAEEDKKLLVKFFLKPRPDNAASLAEGRPMFKDTEYIDIRIPGDRTGGVCRPATHADKQRFNPHYQAFKNRTEAPLEGTPLAEWPLITRSLAEELAFHNVKTVEHLATMSDTHSGKFMGLNALKAKALKWLEQAGEEAKVHELQDQLLQRDTKLEEQSGQIAQLQQQMLDMMNEKGSPVSRAEAPAVPTPTTDPVVEATAAPAPKRARRKRKVNTDGPIQDDK